MGGGSHAAGSAAAIVADQKGAHKSAARTHGHPGPASCGAFHFHARKI